MEDCKRNAAAGIEMMMETTSSSSKRRKIVGSKQLPPHSSTTTTIDDDDDDDDEQLGLAVNSHPKLENASSPGGDFTCLDRSSPLAASCCSSNESSEDHVKLRLGDLEVEVAKSFETADSTSINNSKKYFSRETTPSSELCGDSEETESAPASHRRRSTVGKAPPVDEIEEFFAMVEKSEQKRFKEKYNFDIVNDTPLEGRYQWDCLKP